MLNYQGVTHESFFGGGYLRLAISPVQEVREAGYLRAPCDV
jgi:hypothetical protein